MAFVVHENLNMIAVGFKDGTVVLYRGSILRDHKLHPRIIHSEPAPTVYTGDPVYVTGEGGRGEGRGGEGKGRGGREGGREECQWREGEGMKRERLGEGDVK